MEEKDELKRDYYRTHGSPYDRGTADAYYHRPKQPHYYERNSYSTERIEEKDMTGQQLSDYDLGYEMTTDRKDFGEFDNG